MLRASPIVRSYSWPQKARTLLSTPSSRNSPARKIADVRAMEAGQIAELNSNRCSARKTFVTRGAKHRCTTESLFRAQLLDLAAKLFVFRTQLSQFPLQLRRRRRFII